MKVVEFIKYGFNNTSFTATNKASNIDMSCLLGAQWLSGRVLDLRPSDPGFEPHRCHSGSSLTGITALWSLSKTHLS